MLLLLPSTFETIRGARRRSLVKVISPRCEITRSIQSTGTVLFVMVVCDLVCHKRYAPLT